jgi:hypothetical protein
MKHWKALVVGTAVAVLATASWLVAQPVVQNTFSGNECWNAGQGPGGPSTGFVCGQAFRGAANSLQMTVAGAFTIGGTSANTTPNNTSTLQYGGILLITGTPATSAITMPPNPLMDGVIVAICNVTASPFANTLTATANGAGQTISAGGALAALAAFTCGTFQWNLANATWYRTR